MADSATYEYIDTPPFITVMVGQPKVPYPQPGDTDPVIPQRLTLPLEGYRTRVLDIRSKMFLTNLIDLLWWQSSRMMQGRRKAWFDMQPFEDVVPIGVDYQCKEDMGKKGVLRIEQCRQASWGFMNHGEVMIEQAKPLKFQSGRYPLRSSCLFSSIRPWACHK